MLLPLGRRGITALVPGLLTAALWTALAVPPSAAAEREGEGPGPAMLTSLQARLGNLTCHLQQDESDRPPVLLVPGTAMTAEQNWEPTYRPVLTDRGHDVCLVDLPAYATRDVDANAEYVATAIRTMAERLDERVSVIGHSQGAYLPLVALRTWSDLPAHVDDVIGLAGVYDHGSSALATRCRVRCNPVLHQLAAGSDFLASVSRRALPAGPTYTNIGALGDRTVTPQPAANHQPGATSVMVQDVCSGREIPLPEHAMIAGDNVALGLALDALDNPGPAVLTRLDPTVCEEQQYPEFDESAFWAAATTTNVRLGAGVREEPRLLCRRVSACRNARLRGVVTTSTRFDVRRRHVAVTARAQVPGRIRISLGHRAVFRRVQPGVVTLKVRRPVRRAELLVQTRLPHFTAWATEDSRWVGGRS